MQVFPQDIHEIQRAAESSSWKIREEAVKKLKARINEERGFNSRERKIVLQLFELLLGDNHAKILGSVRDYEFHLLIFAFFHVIL